MKASICLLVIVVLAIFAGRSYLSDPKKITHYIPRHVEAFDLSQFENVEFIAEVPYTGAKFTGANCTQLGDNFAKSLSKNITSKNTPDSEHIWDIHLDHINVLSRELAGHKLDCNADGLLQTIEGVLTSRVKSNQHLSLVFSELGIDNVSDWIAAIGDLIASVLEPEESLS